MQRARPRASDALVCIEYYYVNFSWRFRLLTFIRFRDLTQIIFLWITLMYLYTIAKSYLGAVEQPGSSSDS